MAGHNGVSGPVQKMMIKWTCMSNNKYLTSNIQLKSFTGRIIWIACCTIVHSFIIITCLVNYKVWLIRHITVIEDPYKTNNSRVGFRTAAKINFFVKSYPLEFTVSTKTWPT